MDVFHPVPKHDKHTEIIIRWNSILEFDKQKENKKNSTNIWNNVFQLESFLQIDWFNSCVERNLRFYWEPPDLYLNFFNKEIKELPVPVFLKMLWTPEPLVLVLSYFQNQKKLFWFWVFLKIERTHDSHLKNWQRNPGFRGGSLAQFFNPGLRVKNWLYAFF